MKKLLAAAVLVGAMVVGAPAFASVIKCDGGAAGSPSATCGGDPYHSGDIAQYLITKLAPGDTTATINFTVAPGTTYVDVADGQEAASSALNDWKWATLNPFTSIVLTSSGAPAPTTVTDSFTLGACTPSPCTKVIDGFSAQFGNLVAGEIYHLSLYFSITGSSDPAKLTNFGGKFQFFGAGSPGGGPAPLPAALLLFGSAVGGAGIVSRWRKRRGSAPA